MRTCFALLLLFGVHQAALASTSVFESKPDDPQAIVLKAAGDGSADDSDLIQAAIDKAGKDRKGGIVFVPSGRYRISKTIFVRSAVRIFGFGPTRPVFVLGPNTPGFTSGAATMFSFTGEDQYTVGQAAVPPPTSVPANPKIIDATSSTFYTTMANVDIEIGEGNAGATGVRNRSAQHSYLSHIDFRIGSGLAGIYQVGNYGQNLRFIGGRYGILTEKTSPAWQYTLVDSEFEGQRDAAIREHEAALTMVNVAIRNTPVGIEIDRGYGDSLWGKDVRFENVSRAGIIISNEGNVYTQVGFDNAVATNTPVFAWFRDSGRAVKAPGGHYRVKSFSYGLTLPSVGEMGRYETRADVEALRTVPPRPIRAVRLLPPVQNWVNVRSLGVKGDDKTDDTAALQRAINAHRVLYLPSGRYRVSETIKLRPDTVLIALHPSLTHIYLPDAAPAFMGIGAPKGIVESARGGSAVLSGVGLWTGTLNMRASALIWKAGPNSLVEDVKIQGGGGTYLGPGSRKIENDPKQRWDFQGPSIWVTDGGGGTFTNIWSPNTFARTGFYVSNTTTLGNVYQLSAEHHVRNEIVLDGVENWEFLAPQTEQEVRDGLDAISMEVRNSRNVLFANYHGYRVTRTLKPAAVAVKLYNSGDIRFRNVHVNAESGFQSCDYRGCGTYTRASKFPFENAIWDVTRRQEVREREFAVLNIPQVGAAAAPIPEPTSRLQKLETGFYSIGGGAVDSRGRVYFVEKHFNRIYRWSGDKGLELIADAPVEPANLAVDRSGNLLVLSHLGRDSSVYSLDPARPQEVRLIEPTLTRPRPTARTLLPGNIWINGEFRDRLNPQTYEFTTLAEMFAASVGQAKDKEYVSPDGSLVLPQFRVWNQGALDHTGWRWSDSLDTNGFVTGQLGDRVFVTNSSENKTYSGVIGKGGSLADLRVLANRGGESVAQGPDGRVYVANGHIHIYGADGSEQGRIEVPERPLQLLFGGEDKKTLFIITHRSLYATAVPAHAKH
ncbi:MAG: glycosyl hydrolase family 28-related protein [Sphingomicrobium sp.]